MRFVLIDSKKANEEEIENLPSVKGTFTQAGQYQVIIGNDVASFYNEFTAYAGIEGVSKDAVKEPESGAEDHGRSGRDLCTADPGPDLRRSCTGLPKCGVIGKLDYIKELGADYIWLTPFLYRRRMTMAMMWRIIIISIRATARWLTWRS